VDLRYTAFLLLIMIKGIFKTGGWVPFCYLWAFLSPFYCAWWYCLFYLYCSTTGIPYL